VRQYTILNKVIEHISIYSTIYNLTIKYSNTQHIQFCMHVAGMLVHRLAQVWNAIITGDLEVFLFNAVCGRA